MFDTLLIRNLAIIDEAEVRFKNGLNIVSGETGAGKSILLQAISLLLGGRASIDMIRHESEEAVIEGFFNLKGMDEVESRLEDLGIHDLEAPGSLLIKRTIARSGRHRIFANGSLITLTQLQQLTRGLVELCGQNEHQSLLSSAYQLKLLDLFGQNQKALTDYQAVYKNWTERHAEKATLLARAPETEQKLDFLKFQREELQKANLSLEEEQELHTQKQIAQSSHVRTDLLQRIADALEGEPSAPALLREAHQASKKLLELDPEAASLVTEIEQALIHAEESSLFAHRLQKTFSREAFSLDEIQDRLALIAKLKRKYGGTLESVIETRDRLDQEVHSLENLQERLGEIDGEIRKLLPVLTNKAEALSKVRKQTATKLSKKVSTELQELKMTDADFKIEVDAQTDPENWGLSGMDTIQYLLKSNKGSSLKPIAKIASGGELSRILLALRRVVAEKGGIGVYLFDEIDAGMGGQTAFEVGKKLKFVASHHQVICITHLPQVASFADHHLVVSKTDHGKQTLTRIDALTPLNRKEELARMLGGPTLTRRSLENAEELLAIAKKFK